MTVLSIVNMKGGVAKTTLATNLADVLSQREGKKVLLIDADPQFNATQCLMSGDDYVTYRTSGHTIVDIFDDEPRVVTSPVSGSIIREPVPIESITPRTIKDNFDLMPGNLELYRLDTRSVQGRENRLKLFANHLRRHSTYNYIIIDTPPTPSTWMTSALLASDYYIIPLKPEPLSTTGIDLLKGVVERTTRNFSVDLKCLGVVITIAEEATIVYRNTVHFLDNNNVWRGKRFQNALPKRTEIAREQANQRLILDLDDSAAKLAITAIVREIIERINNG
ncbi:ParA family protein [candidate division WS5 bacterium]|uniref:ParA family protein n=1 Tax=candidate division WS5 bacterium TaxID=2093353 RepID=A0A419DC04_9BACT|nr:MAG: ParA family protein [candidate division WS5 bacterium]